MPTLRCCGKCGRVIGRGRCPCWGTVAVAITKSVPAGDGSLDPLDGALEAELALAREAKARAIKDGNMMLYQYWLIEVVDLQRRMDTKRRQRPIGGDDRFSPAQPSVES